MKKITPIIIILILAITAGYIIINNHTNNTPEFSQGLQLANLNFEQTPEKYLIQITLSPEQTQKQVTQINVELYNEKSIIYRNTITEINENPLTYAIPKDKVRANITSILITSFNNNEVIGTTYLKL